MRVTLEYVLLDGVNDTRDDARRLAGIRARAALQGQPDRVQSASGGALSAPTARAGSPLSCEAMYPIAPAVTLRYSKGRDILAACGQLSTAWTNRARPVRRPAG